MLPASVGRPPTAPEAEDGTQRHPPAGGSIEHEIFEVAKESARSAELRDNPTEAHPPSLTSAVGDMLAQ